MKFLLLVGAFAMAATTANADSFKCGSGRTGTSNARWFAQVSNSRTAGEGRVPAFFLLTNAKAKGTIVKTDDRRRIVLSGKGEKGTDYTVNLNEEEYDLLLEKADKRLNLKDAAKVTIHVNYEVNEDLTDGQERDGDLVVSDEKGKQIYKSDLGCTYDDATN